MTMHKKRVWLLPISLLFIIGATVILPHLALAVTGSTGMGISAGAAKVVITPDTQYIAAEGVNDDLYARCVAINWKDVNVVLVNLDLLGVGIEDIVMPIRDGVEASYGIDGDYVLIGSTHTHGSGVDVIGVYSGSTNPYIVNVYKPLLIDKVVEVIGLALDDMRRAAVQVGSVSASGMSYNRRYYPYPPFEVGPVDDELTAVRFVDLDGETIATLVNFAVHPVITMTGTLISADFCGYLCEELEGEFGGVGIYFNGAQGNIGMPYGGPAMYEVAEEYGHDLAVFAFQALQNGRIFENLPLEVAKTTVELPVENPGFIYLMMMGLVQRTVIPSNGGYLIQTEVSGVKMGPIEMLAVPGELFSEIALFLKANMPQYGFLLGLTTELLGYIIPPEQWAPETGQIGESMSLGVQTAPILTDALLQVIAELE